MPNCPLKARSLPIDIVGEPKFMSPLEQMECSASCLGPVEVPVEVKLFFGLFGPKIQRTADQCAYTGEVALRSLLGDVLFGDLGK